MVDGCGTVRTANGGPLPAVSPLPSPHAPQWIAKFSPSGSVDTLTQIRVQFKNPIIALESLESPDEAAKLQYFSIDPALPGHFRFLTPRLVGFEGDAALPIATRIRITVNAGLSDLNGDRLAKPLSWTFTTQPLELSNLPEPNNPITLTPRLEFNSNAELDPASLASKVTLRSNGGVAIPVNVALEKSRFRDYDQSATRFDPSLRVWTYTVTPTAPLAKSTTYVLTFAHGLMPAHGNMPLAADTNDAVETYSPLSFIGLRPSAPGRFDAGDPELDFNNTVTADSARTQITISPTPHPWAQLVRTDYDVDRIQLEPAAFDPARDYTITLGAGLTDVFGQQLGTQKIIHYHTGDLAPDFWAPTGFSIFPSANDLQLQFSAVNLPAGSYHAVYKVLSPTDLMRSDPSDLQYGSGGFLPDPKDWKQFHIALKKNDPAEIPVRLRDLLGGSTGILAYGVEGDTNSPLDVQYADYGAVQMTNLGVFAQWFPDSGLVRVHHLSDGSPASGAQVDLYPSLLYVDQRSSIPAERCASGATDSSGTAQFDAPSLRACMSGGTSFSQPAEIVAVAHEGADWSFARTYGWSGAFGYGVDAGWDDGTPQSRGVIYSDRELYQPGESGWFTGAAYYLERGELRRSAGVRLHLTLEDPSGNISDLGSVTTDDVGSFTRQVAFKANQPLGYYAIHAKSSDGLQIDGQFRVAQFRPPNFKVTLTLNKNVVAAGDRVTATSQSNYLFGPPVQGGNASYNVTRSQTEFAPKGWDDFTFGPQWEWPESPPSTSSDVMQAKVALGKDGSDTQRIDVASYLPYAMTYQVDVSTSDVSNIAVSDSKTFTALPSTSLIGVQNDWVAQSTQPVSVKVIVVDPDGNPLSGRRVHVDLQEIKYDYAAQAVEGGETSLQQAEYKTVAQTDVTSADTPVVASLTAPASGSYRVRANFANARTDSTGTDSYIWVAGPNPVFWAGQNPDQLQIKLDKPSYRPGDTARALIQSPYPDAELYFAVIRRDPIYHAVRMAHGGAPVFSFTVTRDMLPNAAVEAILVRTGTPLSKTQPGSIDGLARIGFAPFEVKRDSQYLKVGVAVGKSSALPGGSQTVRFHLTDAQGRPVRGEIAVAVANESVLQLSGYRLPDLVSIVYADQDITTRFADNRPNVIFQQPASPIEKGWGFGGGASEAAAATTIRTNFKPLAYYSGAVRTDASGNAQVAFSLPDDLTTWRVMAVATGAQTDAFGGFRFGDGDATFVTDKPLDTNPLLPQFARPGDRFDAGVAVTNAQGLSGALQVRGAVEGAMRFDEASGQTLTDESQATLSAGTSAYRFPVTTPASGDARVRFSTAGGGASDAFAVSIPVVPVSYFEQVVESGVTDTSVSIPVRVDPNVDRSAGGLHVSMASSLLPEIVEPALAVVTCECLPLLEPTASQLAVASDLVDLERKYGDVHAAFSPARVAAQDVAYLEALQRPDGGFADWPSASVSDARLSAYAAQAIGAAMASGMTVDPAMVANLHRYLAAELADPSDVCLHQDDVCWAHVRLEMLEGLAALGDVRANFLPDIYASRDQFEYSARLELARYLLQFDAWHAQGRDMAAKADQNVYETGRTATVNVHPANGWYWWYDSLSTQQAQMLRLAIANHEDPEFIDRIVEGLLALRRNGTWVDQYEDEQALAALIDYAALEQTPPDFKASAALSGRTLANVAFHGYAKTSQTTDVAMAALPAGGSVLRLSKAGTGSLHYFAAYNYTLQGPQPGIIAGLRVLRIVRRAGDQNVLWQSGLATPSAPLSLSVGQVFDIELEVIVDHPVDDVIITDPLPAGFEAIHTTFRTSPQNFQILTDDWQLDYLDFYSDRVVAFGDHLDPGDYSFHYLVRSVTPGTFSWPGAEAHLQFAPETFGRSAGGTLQLSE